MRAYLSAVALTISLCLASPATAQTDPTLGPSAYASRGMQAIDRDWSPSDYTVAARILADVPLAQLPRTGSAQSGVVLDRLTNRSSLTLCQNQSADLMTRIQLCAPALNAISQILMRYSVAMESDLSRGEDGLRIMNYSLYLAAEVSDMLTALLPQIDPNAPDYAVRMAGVNQARGGLAQMITGTLLTLEAPPGAFPEHSRAATASALAECYARMIANAPPETRPALAERIRALAANDRNAGVRAALSALPT